MLGGLGKLAGILKQAKSLKGNMQKLQESLAQQRFEADAGAGAVWAEVNGKGELIQVKIDRKATEDLELLDDLVKTAVVAATRKAQEAAKAEIAQLTGGLDIPL